MREIKFRAWDKYAKEMVFAKTIDFGINGAECIVDSSGIIGEVSSEWDLEQFTGLYDKNGQEIYESDVVKCTAHGSNNVFVMQVAYSDVWAMFYVYSDSHKPRGLTVAYHDFEVIGNIHENKELLEEKHAKD